MPGCGGVCAAAVVAVDFGFGVLSEAADFGAGGEELSVVTRGDCGADGALADVDEVAGCAPEASLAALALPDFLAGVASVVVAFAAVVVLASSAAFAFLDFLADFCSAPAFAALADFELSSALAFFDFFDFVVLVSSLLVEAVVLVVAVVAEVSAFFFFAAAANAGVNARQTTSIRIAVKDVGPFPRNVIDFSCVRRWRDGASGSIPGYFVDEKHLILT